MTTQNNTPRLADYAEPAQPLPQELTGEVFRLGQHVLSGNDKLDKIEWAVSGIEEAPQTAKADIEMSAVADAKKYLNKAP